MSGLYSIATYLSRKIEKIFRKSLLFTIIFSFARFIENQWVNSYFKSLYPNEKFLSFFKKNNIVKNHIFHPIIIVLTFSIFLILSLSPISFDLQISIAIAFISFIVGSVIIPKYFFKNYTKDSFIKFNPKDVYSIGFCLILIGVLFFFLSIASVGGVPLLKPSLRYGLKPILTMPVFLMIPGIGLIGSVYLDKFKRGILSRSQVRFRFLVLVAFSGFFLFSLGYRTPIIASLLMMIIIGY